MENHGDKNCKQVEGERSARKMVTAVSHKMRNSFLTVSMYKEPKYQFIQNPAFTRKNLREGCVKKTIAPAVSKAE